MDNPFDTITSPEILQNYVEQYENDMKYIISQDSNPLTIVTNLTRYLEVGYVLISEPYEDKPPSYMNSLRDYMILVNGSKHKLIHKYTLPIDNHALQLLCERRFTSSFIHENNDLYIEVWYTLQPEKRYLIQQINDVINNGPSYDEKREALKTFSELVNSTFQ